MDILDKFILLHLVEDCRVSYSELAKRFNTSAEKINTRIHRLVKERIIKKFTIVPVPALFGAKKAIIFFHTDQPLTIDSIRSLGIHPTVELISLGIGEGFASINFRTKSELDSVVRYFQKVSPVIDQIRAYPVQFLSTESQKEPRRDILALQEIDWLMLIHLREQGRLAIGDLSLRTNIAIETLVERLKFLRTNNLIEETIQINPNKTQKEIWTIFTLELTIHTQPLYEELTRELESLHSYWSSSCFNVIDQPFLLLGFLCSSYNEVEKIQTWLSEIPGLISIEKTITRACYYFPDFRDELLEEKRSSEWFSPERWVTDQKK